MKPLLTVVVSIAFVLLAAPANADAPTNSSNPSATAEPSSPSKLAARSHEGVRDFRRQKEQRLDHEQIQGTWKIITTGESAGGLKNEQRPPLEVAITANTISLPRKDGIVTDVTYTLDPAQTPRAINITRPDPKAPVTQFGIYELDGDTLKLCFSIGPKARPERFDPTDGILLVMRRSSPLVPKLCFGTHRRQSLLPKRRSRASAERVRKPGLGNQQTAPEEAVALAPDRRPEHGDEAEKRLKAQVVLTPQTMARHGFHVECVLFDQTKNEAARPIRATGPIRVSVHFSRTKGPAIKAFESSVFGETAFLVVRDGDAVSLSVPVQLKTFLGNRGGLYVRFWTQKELLPKTQLVLHKEEPGSFIVDLKAFIEKK